VEVLSARIAYLMHGVGGIERAMPVALSSLRESAAGLGVVGMDHIGHSVVV
jgi:hypothetical protein